jgi:hypothetical protein
MAVLALLISTPLKASNVPDGISSLLKRLIAAAIVCRRVLPLR